MSKFANSKIKWPKSVEKLQNGGRLGPDGGGQRAGGPRVSRGGNSRRAKKRRYRHNCQVRSRLLLVSWNAEGVLTKIGELSRWLSDEKVTGGVPGGASTVSWLAAR